MLRPMIPAMTLLIIESVPSVAPTVSSLAIWSESGSAPYCKTVTIDCASACVNWPVIMPGPLIWLLILAEEMTLRSNVMVSWSPICLPVKAPN